MTLKLAEANRAVEAALAKAGQLGIQISVSVCDAYGHLVAHQRMDGAFAGATHGSIGKAICAAETGSPSGEASAKTVDHPLTALLHAGGAPFIQRRGGLPIFRGGESAGGIGVSGAPTNEPDEECARAGLEALASEGYASGNSGPERGQPRPAGPGEGR